MILVDAECNAWDLADDNNVQMFPQHLNECKTVRAIFFSLFLARGENLGMSIVLHTTVDVGESVK